MSNMNRQDRALKDTPSPANGSSLTTQAKAVALNLDPATYGGFTGVTRPSSSRLSNADCLDITVPTAKTRARFASFFASV